MPPLMSLQIDLQTFLMKKITKIRCDLEKICSQKQIPPLIGQSVTEASFSQFELLTEVQIVRFDQNLSIQMM